MSHIKGTRPLLQAALASLLAFTVGGIVPLVGGFFISDPRIRLATVSVRGQRIDLTLSSEWMHSIVAAASLQTAPQTH